MNARSVHHLMGYLKKDLSPDDKQELLALIEDYRQELVRLIVPLTLLLRPPAAARGTACPRRRPKGGPGGCGTPRVGRRAFAAGPKELMFS